MATGGPQRPAPSPRPFSPSPPACGASARRARTRDGAPPPVVTLVTPPGTAEAPPPGTMEPPRASGEELLEVVVEAGAGDILLAGGRDGIYVREAHRGSGLRQGDRLLSACVFFEDVRCEDAARVLRCAQPCRVSVCLKRAGPGGRGPPGTTAAPPQGKGPKAKVARLNLLSLAPLKKKPPPSPPVDVELALPKLALLPPPATPSPPRAVPEAPRPPRVTVREAAAALEVALPGTLTEPGGGTPEPGGGPRLPAVEVAVPKVGVPKVGVPKVAVPKVAVPKVGLGAPAPKEVAPVAPVAPVLAIAVPKVEVGLALPKAGAQGKLPKLGLSCPKTPAEGGEGPKVAGLEVAAPAVALEVALGSGGDAGVPEAKPPKSAPPKVKGAKAGPPGGWELGGWRWGGARLPQFGGSSPDIRSGGDLKARPAGRGGSAESLLGGGPKNWAGGGLGVSIPAVGFSEGGRPRGGEAEEGARKRPALKVPELELAAPGGLGGGKEAAGGGRGAGGAKPPKSLPPAEGEGAEARMRMGSVRKAVLVLVKGKAGGGAEENGGGPFWGFSKPKTEPEAPPRRWVPKVGFSVGGDPPQPPQKQPKVRLPRLELAPPQCPPELTGGAEEGLGAGGGDPKFQLPRLELSPPARSPPPGEEEEEEVNR